MPAKKKPAPERPVAEQVAELLPQLRSFELLDHIQGVFEEAGKRAETYATACEEGVPSDAANEALAYVTMLDDLLPNWALTSSRRARDAARTVETSRGPIKSAVAANR